MISELQLRVLPQVAATDSLLREQVVAECGVAPRRISVYRIVRRSIDARQRQVFVNLGVRVWIDEPVAAAAFEPVDYPNVEGRPEVIVVGAGPGGLFAALRLIELGLRPIVVERGKDVHERKRDLAQISRSHIVDPESNYSFGEGGAGAYSDGKLYTRSKKRGSVEKILRVFCQHGASTDILCDAHPHIGTDRLPRVIENIRNTIIGCGGEVHFRTRMTRLIVADGAVVGIEAEQTQPTEGEAAAAGASADKRPVEFRGPVILATGHSARDVYRMCVRDGIEVEAKGIAVGVRLEHPSELIDRIQYHSRAGRGKWLPAAEYSFVQQCDGRGVYSFCMCPGGFVVPAATGPEQVVVNGMSPSHRNGRWSNSGMVVELHPEDLENDKFGMTNDELGMTNDEVRMTNDELRMTNDGVAGNSSDVNRHPALRMLVFQELMERLAWQQGGRRQTAPAQRMTDFVRGRLSADLPQSSYAPGLVASPLHFWMPKFISSRLQAGFQAFDRKSRGFLTSEATVIGVETRTSAPVRIIRDGATLCHIRLSGLYPCGEGAGYAGGIVSAAIDGERCAEAVSAALTH
ncbi:MAG: FAD-binding protein [Bacteroidaceae bacterium]|nr:FAD-binding protein [Bacteroidaceae bacterium]